MNETGGKNLRLPRTLPMGAGHAQTQTVIQKWNTVDSVQEELHMKGLVDHEKPLFECPELTPEMLTTTDSKDYTTTYVHLMAWFTYVTEMYAVVQSSVLQFENMIDILAAESRKVSREISEGTKKPSKDELADKLILNPEYQEVMLKLQRYKQSQILFKSKVESLERSMRVVSRQVEIRRLDIEQNRTGGSGIQNRGFVGHNRFGERQGG